MRSHKVNQGEATKLPQVVRIPRGALTGHRQEAICKPLTLSLAKTFALAIPSRGEVKDMMSSVGQINVKKRPIVTFSEKAQFENMSEKIVECSESESTESSQMSSRESPYLLISARRLT